MPANLVTLSNTSDRLRMPYDCNLGHGLPVEAGETGDFHPQTAEQLLREEPGVWVAASQPPAVQPSPTPDAAPPAAPAKE